MQHIAYIIRPQYLIYSKDFVTFERFGVALRGWLTDRDGALCLTCAQTFDDQKPKPAAFFLIEFNIRDGTPSHMVMSGICEQCATRTDNELRRAGIRSFFGDELARTAKEFMDPGGHGGKLS
jgi:hypothetical protein